MGGSVVVWKGRVPPEVGSPVVAAGPGVLSRRHMAPVPPRTHSFVGSQDLKAAQASSSIMPSNTPSVHRELGGGKGSRGQGGCGPGRLWARDGFINKADVVGACLPRQGVPGEMGTQTLAASAQRLARDLDAWGCPGFSSCSSSSTPMRSLGVLW